MTPFIQKCIMTRLHKILIGAVVIVLLVLALYPYMRSEETTAGILLDHEIQLQKQKQVKLEEIKQLDAEILETRTKRNELQKAEVCTGTGSDCYLSAF